jgi:hypothetical protein
VAGDAVPFDPPVEVGIAAYEAGVQGEDLAFESIRAAARAAVEQARG